MSLADKLIAKNQQESFYPHYGVDETGLPVPKPVNASYVVARIFGNTDIYQASGEFYIQHQVYKQNKQSLIALCGHPHLVEFEDASASITYKSEINNQVWTQVKRTINEEYGLIWEMLRRMVPPMNKRFIRITPEYVWDKDKSEIIFLPEDLK